MRTPARVNHYADAVTGKPYLQFCSGVQRVHAHRVHIQVFCPAGDIITVQRSHAKVGVVDCSGDLHDFVSSCGIADAWQLSVLGLVLPHRLCSHRTPRLSQEGA